MSVRHELLTGIGYMALAKYSGIIVQLLVTAILARLLTPSDFGVIAIATIIITFFNIISDIGIGPAIIQNKNLSRSDLEHIFSFTLYVGIILSIIFFICAKPIANYYHDKLLYSVCQWLTFPILFYCANIVPQSLQYKYRRFKFTAFTTLSAQAIAGASSVVGAYYGMGIYALVLSQIVSSFILLNVYLGRERLRFHIKVNLRALQKIMSFSIYQFMFSLINYFSRNLDKLLIGRFIGITPLGYYEKSYRLMLLPLQNITFVVTPVMQPLFSSMEKDLYKLAEMYKKVLHFLSYISFPLSVLLFFCSRELILLFFGTQWEKAIMPFKILSLSVSMQILTSTAGSIYQSANATKKLFISGCWCAFFMLTSFGITIFYWGTINAVAYGFLIAQLANTIQCFYLLFRTLHYPLKNILRILLRPFLVGIILFCFLSIEEFFISIENVFWSVLVKSVFSVLISIILIQLLGEYNIFGYIRNKLIFIK